MRANALPSRVVVAAAALLASLSISVRARADYPIVSHRYLADPGSMVYDGQIYLYTSNDDDNAVGGGYSMHSVICVSTSDLKNWTDHGVVFSVPANASWAYNSWAPQPVARNGKIYLYFGNSGSGVGVASSSSPTSGFTDAKGGYLVNGSTPGASGVNSSLFDPGALIDDDGQAYLSFGGNGVGNARIIKLNSDMTSLSGSAVPVAAAQGFFEASFLFKRNSTYYMAYSSDPANGLRIDYVKSASPMTGYTYGGIVAGQPPQNDNNNHASEFAFKDKWYHAYHNRVVAKAAGIDATYKRNLAIEVLEFNADDSIKPVTYTTDGVPMVGTLNPYARVEAETTNAQSGIETETCSAGGMDVTQISTGDWIRVRGVDFGSAGAKKFTASVASTTAGGNIELRLSTQTGTVIGNCPVAVTGGAQMWADASCDVTGATGVQDLYLKFTGSFNFDFWQFTPVDDSIGGGGGGAGGSGGAGASGTNGMSGNAGADASAGGAAAGTGGISSAGGASGSSAGSGGADSTSRGGGAGDVSGAGGLTPGAAGALAGGSASANASGPQGSQDAGCACAVFRTDSRSRPAPYWLLLGAILGLCVRRRHRSGQSGV